MITSNIKQKNEIKLVALVSIMTFICAYLWNFIVIAATETYQVKKLGSIKAARAFVDKLTDTNLPFQLVLTLGTSLTLLLIAFLIIKKFNNDTLNLALIELKSKNSVSKRLFLLGIFAALIITLVVFGGLTLMGLSKFKTSAYSNCSTATMLLSLITSIVLGFVEGFTEEIVYRGIILKTLMSKKGKIFALIVSSLIFSIGHINRLDPVYLLYTFLIGIILGCLYIITDSIYFTIGLHSMWNTLSCLLSVNGDSFVNIKSLMSFQIGDNTYLISVLLSFGLLLLITFFIKGQKAHL